MATLPRCIITALVLVGAFSSTPLDAQNITVKRHWRRTTSGYSDVWGWTHPSGREFAYVGERSGIWIVETTDPNNIKQIAWFSAPTSTWRDFTNYKQYIYVATENKSQRGFRVIDMSNPDVPKDGGYVQTSTMVSAHNVSCDPDAGFIYFSGSNQGVAIYDVKTTPMNPKLVKTWNLYYEHDISVRRGRAYFAEGRRRRVRILNVNNLALNTISLMSPTPGTYCHNAWPCDDDKIVCATDEITSSGTPHMTVWDTSNVLTPVKRGDYVVPGVGVHNVFCSGRTAYISHYADGFHMVDLANPSNPTLLARYDTSSATSGYNGCWGVYPFSDHGLIYASDISNGLYVLQVDCGHMNRYQEGTAGVNGVPRARFDGASPRVGASKLRFEVENLAPNAVGVLVVSGAAGKSTLLGAQINVSLSGAVLAYFQADSNGEASLNTPVPNNGSLGGTRVYFQIVGVEAGGTLSATRGMWAGICK